MFDLLPNEVLEHILTYTPCYHFPLRQVCKLLREQLPVLSGEDFREEVYQRGELFLASHYNLPCSSSNLETILKRGHKSLLRREKKRIPVDCSHLVPACVQGRSQYIINYLLRKGHVQRRDVLDEACRQNYVELVKKLYEREEELRDCTLLAVCAEALDVLSWLSEKDNLQTTILNMAVQHRRTKVLKWLPQETLAYLRKRDLFFYACSAPDLSMFEFMLENNLLPQQTLSISTTLAASPHAEMMKRLVLDRGWVLDEEMFETALREGCTDMLSCLLELGCPRGEDLYRVTRKVNLPWLVENFPLDEEDMLDECKLGTRQSVILALLRGGHPPEHFKNNPELTLNVLNLGHIEAAQVYLEEGYAFYKDVCLRVEKTISLRWLIEERINLSPDLYYHLVRQVNLLLLKKLHKVLPLPDDLLIYTLSIMPENNPRLCKRLQSIAQWIRDR